MRNVVMKSPKRVLALAVLSAAWVASFPAHADQCRLPPAPSKIPDGETASKQEMITAMEVVKRYNRDVQAYLTCLEFAAGQNEVSPDTQMSQHDAAVDQLRRIANEFNAQVRTFKAKRR